MAYRLIANGGNTWLERGTTTVPDYEFTIPEEGEYFVSIGVLPADVFDTTQMTEGEEYEINYEVSENGYVRIWATDTGEPIIITNKGEADLVLLSMEAFEEREQLYRHRDKIYEAEFARLNGAPTYTPEQIHEELEALYAAGEE